MIGINSSGKPKVWINSNFVLNYPEQKGLERFSKKVSEKEMLK